MPLVSRNVAVIHSVMHRANRRSRWSDDEVSREGSGNVPPEGRVSERERRQIAERNTALPRLAGVLIESSRGMLGGESEQPRWVVLDPREKTLSIWERPPHEDASLPEASELMRTPRGRGPFNSGAVCCPKVPKKAYSMEKFRDADSNPSFRNMFVRFEGASNVVCITAVDQEDFQRWMEAFDAYNVKRPQASKI